MKYEFTGETKVYLGITLKRIRAIIEIDAFGVAKGSLGGWIEKESNLSHSGNAWVQGSARIHGNARIYDNALVQGNARIHGNAHIYDNALVSGNARIYGNAHVFGNAHIRGNALVSEKILCASRSDGYLFVCCQDKSKAVIIIAGCRYFTIPQARKHWRKTRGGTRLGSESLALVDHLERMAKIAGWIR